MTGFKMAIVITEAKVKGCDCCGKRDVLAHWIKIENPLGIDCNPDVIKICTSCLTQLRDKIRQYLRSIISVDDSDIAQEELSQAEKEIIKDFLRL